MSCIKKNNLTAVVVIFITMIVFYVTPSFCQELFPSSLPGGFDKEDSLATFNLETLYKYLGDSSEQFLELGFNGLLVQTYKKENSTLNVEVFEMTNQKNAFEVFAYYRDEIAKFIEIGSAGFAKEDSAAFFFDRYYVRLNGTPGSANAMTLSAAAGQIAGELKRIYPNITSVLPIEAQLLKTDNLYLSSLRPARNVLDMDFLGDGYRGLYNFSGKTLTAYILTYKDIAAAGEAFKRYREDKKFSFMGIRELGEKCHFYVYGSNENMSLNFLLGNHLVIVTDFTINQFGSDLASMIERNLKEKPAGSE